jgi:predicted transposase YbfD/YdcC
MTHLVSAFVEANRTVFGQLAVKEKSNEIEVIPRLLSLLDLEGATITIDAMGCQKEVAQQIHHGGGDYVLAVKENQPTLHQKVKLLLDEAILDGFEDMSHDRFQSTDGGHGRIETRKIWVSDEVHWLGELLEQWPGLTAVAAVESKRQVIGGKTSVERRYFITNRPNASAQWIAQAVRGHWSVENQLHWQLDVSFDEDQRRIRKNYGAENYSRLCRIALNLLKRDKSAKIGIHGKRLKAGWDLAYLLKVFTG